MEDIEPFAPITGSAVTVAGEFRRRYGPPCGVFRAPGRVNLIGEHTDYNDGFVMPCALGFTTRVAVSPRADRSINLHSEDFPDVQQFSLDRLPASRLDSWADYLIGVLVQLQRTGSLSQGANVLVSGEVPVAAGLSSSAALEVASALAFMDLNGIVMPLPQVAKIGRAHV